MDEIINIRARYRHTCWCVCVCHLPLILFGATITPQVLLILNLDTGLFVHLTCSP